VLHRRIPGRRAESGRRKAEDKKAQHEAGLSGGRTGTTGLPSGDAGFRSARARGHARGHAGGAEDGGGAFVRHGRAVCRGGRRRRKRRLSSPWRPRSEEHTSELQSRENLVCRLLLEKKDIESI